MTVTFWDCIPISKRVAAYDILANQYRADTGDLLPRPPGMSGENTGRQPPVINAPGWEEEQEMALDKEVRQTPRHMRKVE